MSTVKRRKTGGEVPDAILGKTSSGLESAESSSPDPDFSDEASEEKAQEDVQSTKTFKDLVCAMELSIF